jgi:hypothetical protein
MRIHDIDPTIARSRRAFPLAPRFIFVLALALSAAGACRGGCARKVDPAATVAGRLALLPEPTRVVVSIDFAKLRASPAAAKLAALAQQTPEDTRRLEELASRTALDPLKDLDSLLIGFPEDARQRGELALVLRAEKLVEARLVAYARDELQKKGDDLVGTPHGRFTLWSPRRQPELAGFFVDEHTFVLGAGGWAPRLADLAATARPGDSAATNLDLARLVARAGDHALWAAALVPAEVRKSLADDPNAGGAAGLQSFVVGIDLAHGLESLLVGDVATAGDAQALVEKTQQALRDGKRNAQVLMLGLGPYLDGISARASDKRYELRATLTEPQLDDLLGRLGAFLTLARQGAPPSFK